MFTTRVTGLGSDPPHLSLLSSSPCAFPGNLPFLKRARKCAGSHLCLCFPLGVASARILSGSTHSWPSSSGRQHLSRAPHLRAPSTPAQEDKTALVPGLWWLCKLPPAPTLAELVSSEAIACLIPVCEPRDLGTWQLPRK